MQKEVRRSRLKPVLLTILAVFFVLFIILPVFYSLFDGSKIGNIALIKINGIITANGDSYLGQSTASSEEIVSYLQQAEQDKQFKVIILEINSPGGSPVASDEIASAVKSAKAKKPVIAIIRETGASGAYWIASASDYIFANKMSITGSIGVISSYLEFSGLMKEYGVGYEQLTSGKYKDMGSPYQKLTAEEKAILQKKIDKIHEFFTQEIAANRHLPLSKVKDISTGEFYLGSEALELGLVDQLGNAEDVEKYLKETYGLEELDYVIFERKPGFFDLLSKVFSDFSFSIGQGISSVFVEKEGKVMLV